MGKKRPNIAIAAGICIAAAGIAGLWVRTLSVTQTEVAVAQAQQEGEVPEEYTFTEGITENGGVDDYYVSLCNESLEVLPAWMLEMFTESGWTVMVTPEDINEVYLDNRYAASDGSVNGATVYGIQTIAIADTADAASTAAVHEMGHWFDYITSDDDLSFSSESSGFSEVYGEEAEVFISTFGVDNPDAGDRQELCADLFKYYWTEPARLKRACPGLYAWMDSLSCAASTEG